MTMGYFENFDGGECGKKLMKSWPKISRSKRNFKKISEKAINNPN